MRAGRSVGRAGWAVVTWPACGYCQLVRWLARPGGFALWCFSSLFAKSRCGVCGRLCSRSVRSVCVVDEVGAPEGVGIARR